MAYKDKGIKIKSVPLTEEYQRDLELLAKANNTSPTKMLKFLVESAIDSRLHDYGKVKAEDAEHTNI